MATTKRPAPKMPHTGQASQGLRIVWNFIVRAAPFAGRVQGLRSEGIQLGGGGQVVVPVKGDRLRLRLKDSADVVWFKCADRRFDFAATDGPVLQIDLELG